MLDDVRSLAASMMEAPGIAGKRDIAQATAALGLGGASPVPVGDDCAAIPDGDGWLLFACEGFQNEFVAAMPWFAGWCGVMVNLSDIAAMGGRPTAVVDAIWARSCESAGPILGGLKAASEAYGVPIVGGHTNLRSSADQLSVSVIGRANALLTSFDAEPGDTLVMAVDLRGAYHDPHPFFDAASTAPPERLRTDLEILPAIAEQGLSKAAKDISQGGIIGTAIMLAECSGVGITIDPLAVPRPDGADLARWLGAFPSYGFLLSVSPMNVPAVVDRFSARGIAAAPIGRVDTNRQFRIVEDGCPVTICDLAAETLIGCGPVKDLNNA